MDQELKQRWLEALRSGEYLQGTDRLRNGNTFCCLGVLCDIVDPNGWASPNEMGDRMYVNTEDLTNCEFEVPKTLADKIKLKNEHQVYLSNINDHGSSFEEIADWIEGNL